MRHFKASLLAMMHEGRGHWHGGRFGGRGGERCGAAFMSEGEESGRGGRFGGRGFDGSGRHGGFGGRGRGRVFGSGDLRLVLLALIAEQPRHGYELIKDIEQQFGGGYSPSPGSVYPTLTLLSEQGLIEASDSDGAKKLFKITPAGEAFLGENAAMVTAVRGRMGMAARAMAGQSAPEAIFQAMQTLKAALMLHRRGWDAAEADRVAKILARAAADIEGVAPDAGR